MKGIMGVTLLGIALTAAGMAYGQAPCAVQQTAPNQVVITCPTATPSPSPTPSPTVSPSPSPSPSPTALPTPAAPVHFSTLGPHATLPTEAECAAWVNAIPMAEVVPANAAFNQTVPTAAQLSAFHTNPQPFKGDSQGIPADFLGATGNFTGSTDMLIRWAACKWGIDEDVVRAQAQNESGGWLQGGHGDKRTTQSACVQSNYPQLQIWNTTIPLPDGSSVSCPNCCYQSWGITQNKLYYEPTAFPAAVNSTAFTLDLTYSTWRSCINGDWSIYFASQGANTYAADVAGGNVSRLLWGCVGTHFSGGWWDSGATTYIGQVQSILNARSWP